MWGIPSHIGFFFSIHTTRCDKEWSFTSPSLVGLHTYMWCTHCFVSSVLPFSTVVCCSFSTKHGLHIVWIFFINFFWQHMTWVGGFYMTFYLPLDGNSDVWRPHPTMILLPCRRPHLHIWVRNICQHSFGSLHLSLPSTIMAYFLYCETNAVQHPRCVNRK